ncbi:hypothetical protein BHF71_07090 [Vulcanibacillus modesticaldus]|uniref:AMP-dependent synthetase/ligase domain-containing protein n=2 Tax=Vulcanibacillus modesticaldus TaxID=337097 RepID=A0A1D2YWE3_9BACI|nr:hypothetical protein BHF71_07090 [Vulcanibacillus modesticaldus]
MDAKAIIYHPQFADQVKELEITRYPLSIKEIDFLKSYPKEDLNLDILDKDTAEILLTSGTTGRPEGVMLSHQAVYQVAMMMSYEMQFKYGDRILQIMPLSHSAPLNLTLMGSVFSGATSYYPFLWRSNCLFIGIKNSRVQKL